MVRSIRCRRVFLVVDGVLKEGNAEEVGDAGLGNTEEESGDQLLSTLEGRGVLGIVLIQQRVGNPSIEYR